MGSATRAITDRITKQIVTIFSKTCNKVKLFRFLHDLVRKCDIVTTIFKGLFCSGHRMSECLHATSSNALFCTHYVGNVNYRSLMTVTFPIGSIGKPRTPG